MELLLNERVYAEKVLSEGIVDKKPSATVQLLVRYYQQIHDLRRKKILELVNGFMLENYPGYNPDDWYDVITKYVNNAKKYPLIQCDFLQISDLELDIIRKIGDEQAEKLMFTCLCLAKQYNAARPENSNWVNLELPKLFKLANMSGNKRSKLLKIHLLKMNRLISMSLKCSNTNIRVEIISDGADYAISDLTDLGNQQMVLVDRGFFCQKCGKQEKQNKNRTKKYCKNCVSPTLSRIVVCEDCGCTFEVSSKNTKSTRCDECNKEHRRKMVAKNVKNHREQSKNVITAKQDEN